MISYTWGCVCVSTKSFGDGVPVMVASDGLYSLSFPLDYMPPYVAQGASNALEDAATLAMAFTCTEDIERALEVYQQVRKTRSEWIQASAKSTGHVLHLPDGEGQRRRDESIQAASRGVGANPDQWGDKQSHETMWRADVMAETIGKFQIPTAGAEDR